MNSYENKNAIALAKDIAVRKPIKSHIRFTIEI